MLVANKSNIPALEPAGQKTERISGGDAAPASFACCQYVDPTQTRPCKRDQLIYAGMRHPDSRPFLRRPVIPGSSLAWIGTCQCQCQGQLWPPSRGRREADKVDRPWGCPEHGCCCAQAAKSVLLYRCKPHYNVPAGWFIPKVRIRRTRRTSPSSSVLALICLSFLDHSRRPPYSRRHTRQTSS